MTRPRGAHPTSQTAEPGSVMGGERCPSWCAAGGPAAADGGVCPAVSQDLRLSPGNSFTSGWWDSAFKCSHTGNTAKVKLHLLKSVVKSLFPGALKATSPLRV